MKEYFTIEDLQEVLKLSRSEIISLANGEILPAGKNIRGVRKWAFGEIMSYMLNHLKG